MDFAIAILVGGLTFGGPKERVQDESGGDRWFARDKLHHVVASALIQGIGHSVLRANGRDYREAALTAAGLTATAGVSKEAWDRWRGRQFSWKDLAADAAGGGAGAVVVRQLGK